MNPFRRVLRAMQLSLAVVLSAGTATADPPLGAPWLYERMATTPLERGQIYLGFTAWGGVQQLPRFNSSMSIFDGLGGNLIGPSSFEADVRGLQPGGEFGIVLPDGTLPGWIGSRPRIGVFGSAAFFERATDRVTNLGPTGIGNYHNVTGQRSTSPLP